MSEIKKTGITREALEAFFRELEISDKARKMNEEFMLRKLKAEHFILEPNYPSCVNYKKK